MSRADPVQCASCGWTGRETDLDGTAGDSSCPVCGEQIPSAA